MSGRERKHLFSAIAFCFLIQLEFFLVQGKGKGAAGGFIDDN